MSDDRKPIPQPALKVRLVLQDLDPAKSAQGKTPNNIGNVQIHPIHNGKKQQPQHTRPNP